MVREFREFQIAPILLSTLYIQNISLPPKHTGHVSSEDEFLYANIYEPVTFDAGSINPQLVCHFAPPLNWVPSFLGSHQLDLFALKFAGELSK